MQLPILTVVIAHSQRAGSQQIGAWGDRRRAEPV
jgi:hypothetical protein